MPKCRKLKHFPLYEQQQSMSERIAFSIEVNEIKQFQVNNPKIDSIRFKSFFKFFKNFLYNRISATVIVAIALGCNLSTNLLLYSDYTASDIGFQFFHQVII